MKKQFSKEKTNRIIWAAAILTAIGFVIIGNVVNTQEKNLLKDGIREEVVVVKKYSTGTIKSPQYAMDVDWFKVVKETPLHKPKDTTGLSKGEQLSEQAMAILFKDKKRKNIERNHTTVRLSYVNGDSYHNLTVGDIVTLVYFKDRPKDGRLLRELQ